MLADKKVPKVLESFAKNFNELKFISAVSRVYQHSDLPKFFSYSAVMSNSSSETDGELNYDKKASGISFFSEEMALLKCLGEAVERESCATYKNSSLLTSTYKGIHKIALNPLSFEYFSSNQRGDPKYKDFNFDDKTIFRWKKAKELTSGKQVYVPAQTIFYNYNFLKNEGRIGIPISTGAAGGSTFESALIRGILEVIERDSFMICYLNKISKGKVNIKKIKNKEIEFLINLMERYNMDLHIIDVTTDLEIPTYVALVIDKSGLSPAIQIGAKSDFDPISAIIGAISESFIAQSWFREAYFEKELRYEGHIRTIEERGMYWFEKKNIKNLSFWLNQKEKSLELKKRTYSEKKKIEILSKIFKRKGYPVYYIDVSLPVLKKIKYYVIKTIIPNLHPLYFNEDYRYLGGKRLYRTPIEMGFKEKNEEELNNIPHPFP